MVEESDDDVTRADIFITPPCDPNCSDEDSGDKDEGTCHNLTRRQLGAEAVATVTKGEEQIRIDGGDESNTVSTSTLTAIATDSPPTSYLTVDGSAAETLTHGDARVSGRAKISTTNGSMRRLSKPYPVAETLPSSCRTADSAADTLAAGVLTETSAAGVLTEASASGVLTETLSATSSRRRIMKPSLHLRESLASVMSTAVNKLTTAETSSDISSTKHYIEAIQTQRRCAVCSLKVKRQCKKCNVGLHIDCFEQFHEM